MPPMASISAFVMDIPNPVPCIRAIDTSSLRSNGSKIRSTNSGDMPMPLSVIVKATLA